MTDAPWEYQYFASAAGRGLSAGALIRDDAGRLLVVKPSYKPEWELPGGIVQPGETPRHACVRECREELNLALVAVRLGAVDHQIAPYVPLDNVAYLYVATIADGATIRVDGKEIVAACYLEPAAALDLLSARVARRTAWVLAHPGSVGELHDGFCSDVDQS